MPGSSPQCVTPPTVSLITATHNASLHLPHLIDSIRQLRFTGFEWLVIDGASTDGTPALLQSTPEITRWISEPDNGIYDAWNKGLRLARGEWIVFLGADDRLLPDALQQMTDAAAHAPIRPDYVCGRVDLMRAGRRTRTIGRAWDWKHFRHYMCVAHTGSMLHRSYFDRYGSFDPQFRISGDYELLLRAGAGLNAVFVDSVLAEAGLGGASNRDGRVFAENLRAKRMHRSASWWMARLFFVRAWGGWYVRRALGGGG